MTIFIFCYIIIILIHFTKFFKMSFKTLFSKMDSTVQYAILTHVTCTRSNFFQSIAPILTFLCALGACIAAYKNSAIIFGFVGLGIVIYSGYEYSMINVRRRRNFATQFFMRQVVFHCSNKFTYSFFKYFRENFTDDFECRCKIAGMTDIEVLKYQLESLKAYEFWVNSINRDNVYYLKRFFPDFYWMNFANTNMRIYSE